MRADETDGSILKNRIGGTLHVVTQRSGNEFGENGMETGRVRRHLLHSHTYKHIHTKKVPLPHEMKNQIYPLVLLYFKKNLHNLKQKKNKFFSQ